MHHADTACASASPAPKPVSLRKVAVDIGKDVLESWCRHTGLGVVDTTTGQCESRAVGRRGAGVVPGKYSPPAIAQLGLRKEKVEFRMGILLFYV